MLNVEIDVLDGIGPKKKELYRKMGIEYIADLLEYFPVDYRDYRNVVPLKEIPEDKKVLVRGTVIYGVGKTNFRNGVVRIKIGDDSGLIDVVFFNATYVRHFFKKGNKYFFYGKKTIYNGRACIVNPEYYSLNEIKEEIVPVYHTVKGISGKEIVKNVKKVLEAPNGEISVEKNGKKINVTIDDFFPEKLLKNAKLCPLEFMYRNIHFPKNRSSFRIARYRKIYQELFMMEFSMNSWSGKADKGIYMPDEDDKAEKNLPYILTDDQKKAADEIMNDMASGKKMNRLLQGDVGSGKTAVAKLAMYKCMLNGYQTAFMAPTEILAEQHYDSMSSFFKELGYETVLLTGSQSERERKEVLRKIKDGDADAVVGTHAVISDKVSFKNLGLVITDEQHRFGVNQRISLEEKGKNPHLLVMTATPIPRTLAVILYSNLDISVIRHLPAGRKKIITEKVKNDERENLYSKIKKEIIKGRQVYVVAPLIEESEFFPGVKNACNLYDELSARFGSECITVGLIHGNMKQCEKEKQMRDFRDGKTNILVSTVVIEVGVDVPNATVMVIENSERFGLAQLHQLRGRVGRGSEQSYCYLISGSEGEIAEKRIEIMCKSNDGFYIAEQDLKMRGPGEIFGIRQHGIPDSCLVNAVKYSEILEKVREDVLTYHDDMNDIFIEKVNKIYGEKVSLAL